jgi:rubrerythrin
MPSVIVAESATRRPAASSHVRGYDGLVAPIDVATSLENLKLERDAIALYDALATIEREPRRRAAFERIAGNERRHADIWAAKLAEGGATVPPAPGGPRPRVRVIILLARVFGTRAVADLVKALEGDEEALYERLQESAPEVAAIAEDEREHARIWERLATDAPGATGPAGDSATDEVSVASVARSVAEIGQREAWHRAGGRSGTLRAVIFGVSDGLVSNLALVMGVAGAAASDPRFILLTGIAGLLAGAFSMAAGEYISMQSQRELFERQIALERAEMEAMPDEERAELRAAGCRPRHARPGGARPGPGRARVADRRGPWLVRVVRRRGGHPGHPLPVRGWDDHHHHQPGHQPRRPVRGRRRGQPADRAGRAVLRDPPAADRPGGGGRDVRHRLAHRRHDGRMTGR